MKVIVMLSLLFSNWTRAGDLSFSASCNPDEDQAVLTFVGDILIHRPMYQAVVNGSKHFSTLWEKTLPLLLKGDFSAGNVEGPVAMGVDPEGRDHGDIGFVYDDYIYSGTRLVFNYHPRLLSDLQDSGFDLITAANNHASDRKGLGMDKTILAARALGLKLTGLRHSQEPNEVSYVLADIKNIRTAFIGCTEFINGEDPSHQVLGCEENSLLSLIRSLAADPAIAAIIILPHWGVEYSLSVSKYQRELAHRYLEAGASAVIGSHPHVLEPWEKYVTSDKREGLIFYSLGNFVARQIKEETQTGAILYLGLIKEKKNRNNQKKASIFAAAYSPVMREDLSIVPMKINSGKKMEAVVVDFYGSQKRIGMGDDLKKKMCEKKTKEDFRESQKVPDHR